MWLSTAPDRRDAFNVALPQNDRSAFRNDMIAVLIGTIYKRTNADASFLADALLPDGLMFQIGNPNGFGTTIGPGPGVFTGPFAGGQVLGNGRRLADDVVDIDINLLTSGVIPGDNVGDGWTRICELTSILTRSRFGGSPVSTSNDIFRSPRWREKISPSSFGLFSSRTGEGWPLVSHGPCCTDVLSASAAGLRLDDCS